MTIVTSHSRAMNKFKIEVVVQPLQNPDLSVDDLAFSSSLQNVSLVAKENRRDLIAAVAKYSFGENVKCLASPEFVVPGHPRERRR